jgi:hypothetical protein
MVGQKKKNKVCVTCLAIRCDESFKKWMLLFLQQFFKVDGRGALAYNDSGCLVSDCNGRAHRHLWRQTVCG